MIDLTPLDVRKKRGDFRRILRGYDPEEVDTFMELVAERFEELVRSNLALSEKTDRLESQLNALEGRENAIQEALVTAQKLREEVREQSRQDAEILQEQAKREADLLKAEADGEIAHRLSEAESLIRERQRALEDLERNRIKFLKSFRSLLERELDAVEVEEARRPLEDTPVELDLRGWKPGGGLDEEEEAEDAPSGAEEEPVEAEPEQDEEVVTEGMEASVEEVEEDEAEGVEVEVEEAEVEEVEAEVEDGDEEGVPGGFETQIFEGAKPTDLNIQPEEESWSPEEAPSEEAPSEEAPSENEDTSSSPQEPKWLFSLLKKEEERGEEG
jgi:DivIVA domain-containing protein